MVRRLGLGVVLAALALMAATPVQAAEWCLHDPALVFSAPHLKQKLTVYATQGVQGAENAWALERGHLDFTAKPGKGAGTMNLTVHANIPDNGHQAFATVLLVSSQPYGAGTIYGVVVGTSHHTMELSFDFAYDGGQPGP